MLQHHADEILQVKRCLDHKRNDGDETQLKHPVKLDTDLLRAMNSNPKVFVDGGTASEDQPEIAAGSVKVSQPDQIKEAREAETDRAPPCTCS